ncbi:unnamed protein product [Caenorhabditis sp. 36 PRJEB53466]|nr:unnamed protein product [Caenorhabditis sp. 36 PRJEB53466]
MMMMTPASRQVLKIFLLFVVCNASNDKTPSLNEIKNLRNTDLDEIFGATMNKTPPPDYPDMGPPPTGEIGEQELPINHGHALAPPPGMQTNAAELQQLAAQGANVFATGATAFYRGAASVGEAFGIPVGNYQVPLFSQAASLFG